MSRGGVDLNEAEPPVLLSGETFSERPMYTGKTLFAQLMDFLPWTTFARIVERYGGDRYVKSLRCAEHLYWLIFDRTVRLGWCGITGRGRGCSLPGSPPYRGAKDDHRTQGDPGQGWPTGAGQAARQRQPSLQDHGVLAGQLLSFSGALREGRRGRPGRDDQAQADPEEPRRDGDRASRGRARYRAAGLRPGASGQRTQASRPDHLARRRALRLAAPRPGDHA